MGLKQKCVSRCSMAEILSAGWLMAAYSVSFMLEKGLHNFDFILPNY